MRDYFAFNPYECRLEPSVTRVMKLPAVVFGEHGSLKYQRKKGRNLLNITVLNPTDLDFLTWSQMLLPSVPLSSFFGRIAKVSQETRT